MSGVDNEKIAQRMMDLQRLLNQFLDIERMIFLPDGKRKNRRETDTEHSYHLAIMAWYLCDSFPKLNKDKVIRYALTHDLVEIHAGDVMAVGRTKEQDKIKDQKEAEALQRLKSDWQDFPDMTETIRLYEAQADKEAVFVKALDKILPMMHNIMSEGKTWKKYDIDRKTVVELKDEKTEPSPEIAKIWQVFRAEIQNNDSLFNKGKTT